MNSRKVAIVTGSGTGVGAATALMLVQFSQPRPRSPISLARSNRAFTPPTSRGALVRSRTHCVITITINQAIS